MKRAIFLTVLVGVTGLLAACSASPTETYIQPTKDKLTFAFFFTDG
jgi:hypothetical protein